MNKGDYLSELYGYLAGMPLDERDAAMRFYMEYFDDAGNENEESVMQQLGTPRQLADQLLGEMHSPGKIEAAVERVKQGKGRLSVWLWVLIVLASPLLVALGGVAFGLAAAIAAVLFALLVTVASLGIVPIILSITLIPVGIFMAVCGATLVFKDFTTALVFVGGGAAVAAMGGLLFRPTLYLLRFATRGMFRASGYLVRKFRRRTPLAEKEGE